MPDLNLIDHEGLVGEGFKGVLWFLVSEAQTLLLELLNKNVWVVLSLRSFPHVYKPLWVGALHLNIHVAQSLLNQPSGRQTREERGSREVSEVLVLVEMQQQMLAASQHTFMAWKGAEGTALCQCWQLMEIPDERWNLRRNLRLSRGPALSSDTQKEKLCSEEHNQCWTVNCGFLWAY